MMGLRTRELHYNSAIGIIALVFCFIILLLTSNNVAACDSTVQAPSHTTLSQVVDTQPAHLNPHQLSSNHSCCDQMECTASSICDGCQGSCQCVTTIVIDALRASENIQVYGWHTISVLSMALYTSRQPSSILRPPIS